LALDLGDAQVGLAISDEGKRLASGLPTLKGKERQKLLEALRERIDRLEVEEIVVGLPLNMNGTLGIQASKALELVEQLKGTFHLPVKTWDERLTTVAAKRTLIDSGTPRRARGRDALDRLSAILILQAYLDHLAFQERRD